MRKSNFWNLLLIAAIQVATYNLEPTNWNVAAQASDIQWQKALGGSDDDVGLSIQQTTDGGYILVGETKSNDGDVSGNHGGSDAWVVKLNDSGDIQWQKTLGGSSFDRAFSVLHTTDGGYILAGDTWSNDGGVSGNHGGSDAWVVKLNDSGNIQWQRALGGSNDDAAYNIQQTTDGGYILVGYTRSNDGDVSGHHYSDDVWVVKLNYKGIIQWQKALGGYGRDKAYSIQQTTDGGYILAGDTWSNDGGVSGNHGGSDAWVVKLNDSGNIQWQRALGGSQDDAAYSIQQTTDGGYILAGWTLSNDFDVSGNHSHYEDVWVVKLTDSGNIQWQNALGGWGRDWAYGIQQTADGGYILAGKAGSSDGDVTGYHAGGDAWVIKLTDSGDIQWQKALGGNAYDTARSIQQTTDGGYILAGWTGSNNGNVSGNHGGWDAWVVKLKPETVGVTHPNIPGFVYWPTPSDSTININADVEILNVELVDLLGKTVYQSPWQRGLRGEVDISELSSGIYLMRVQTGGQTGTYKVVKK